MKSYLKLFLCLPFLLGVSGCETEAQKEKRRTDEKTLEEFYELELVKCVNELGQERCHIIQETGLWQCRHYQSSPTEVGHDVCARDRFKDRLTLLKEKPEPDAATHLEKPDPQEPTP
jgi:hypothetical protein